VTVAGVPVHAMTIGGTAVPGDGHVVVNPATEEPCGRAPRCTPEQLDTAMAAAASAWPSFGVDDELRRDWLRQAARAVSAAAGRLAATVTAEMGKPLPLAMGEVYAAAATFRHSADLELAPEVLWDDARGFAELVRRPLGVIAAITPWNFPVAIAAAKVAPALRAGDAVVLKPSPHAPLATLQMGGILNEVLPPGMLNVVCGDADLGAAMVSHPVPRQVTFTGSVPAGRRVAELAARDLKRYVLQLGGNDPAIVLDDVDPDEVADQLFWGSFANNGQACLLIKRLYVPRRHYGRLTDALADHARAVRVGDPTDKGVQLGPLANRPQFERVGALVARARTDGARVVAGGAPLDRPGFFYAPTVLADVDDGDPVVADEQFGPVLPVVAYDDVDDAVRRANATEFGLGGSVWSADEQRAWEVADRLDCGTVWVNAHAQLNPGQPIAGMKASGIGVENGRLGLAEHTAVQVRRRPRSARSGPQ
jgi:acyl-CoA reductase-like NAD-dependent aldehyde dehydrogenase